MISCINDMRRGCYHVWMGDERVDVSFYMCHDDPVVRGAFNRLKTYLQVTGEENLTVCGCTATTTRLFYTLYYRVHRLVGGNTRAITQRSVFA